MRQLSGITTNLQREFQSTHPRGVRPVQIVCLSIRLLFQSTHPRGVRRQNFGKIYQYQSFNPRTHEGCDINIKILQLWMISFNPRTHEGCDARTWSSKLQSFVSIHAPTRGATYNHKRRQEISSVSIHAPTRGATWGWLSWLCYNSVSIHAPTRGATLIWIYIGIPV